MVQGLDRLRRKLRRTIPDKVSAAAKAALTKSADEINALQRTLVEEETGALRASIRNSGAVERDGGLVVNIEAGGPTTTKPVRNGQKATYDYALGQEFGTSDQSAQPFFFPGYRGNKKRAKSRITRQVREAIRDGAK